jgi:DNA-binding transcriptional LysR family regulator
MCAPSLAPGIRSAAALLEHTLIESAVKKVRWPAWFAANGMIAPEPRGPRFDRSFLSLRAAMDGLGVTLESTRLAEREMTEGSLVRPLEGVCQDMVYTAHWLVFPRARRYARGVVLFAEWTARELGLRLDLDALELPSGVNR